MTPSDVKATLSFSDGSPSMDLPLYKGSIGPDVIEVLGMMRSPQFSRAQEDQGPFRARVVETSPATPPTRHSRNDHDSV